MLNIVIPMAGRGNRFAQQGYQLPKPLIPIHGVPMIKVVIDNLKPRIPHTFTFICQASHLAEYDLGRKLQLWAPGANVVTIDRITEGAACTVLLTEEIINTDDSLMIANCDQYVDVDINAYLGQMTKKGLDGLIMTMSANDNKWSYVGFDQSGRVNRVVEKEVISNEATVGIYNFQRGRDFVAAAHRMIAKNLRVNNEFYVAPTYNEMVEDGAHLGVHSVGTLGNGMYGIGVPEDLLAFEALPVSYHAAGRGRVAA
jgi:NDP-sugar pyrophosphorylase family protein